MGRDAAVLHNEEQDAVQDQHGSNGDVIVEVIFHPVVQRADDKHRQGGGHHLEPQAPDAGLGNDAAPLHAKGPQLAPEQHHHRHDGTQLDDHPEHGHELFTCIEFDDLLQQDHMTGGRDREPFGNALHNAHQDRFDDLEKRKNPSLCQSTALILYQYTILCLSAHAECKILPEGPLPLRKSIFRMKASPGRGKLSPQVTDEGADKQQLTDNYPSSGAMRHLFPLLSLRDIFPRRGGNLSPRGEGFCTGQAVILFSVFLLIMYIFLRARMLYLDVVSHYYQEKVLSYHE